MNSFCIFIFLKNRIWIHKNNWSGT